MPRDVSEERRGAAAWLRRWWRPLLGELLATALLVLLGVAALLPRDAPLTHAALAFGFAVLINVEAFGPVSGAHMNPAVTLGAVLAGALGWRPALAYAAAQALGGVLGFGALLALARGPLPAGAGCTVPALAPAAAVALEAVLTGALLLLCCALWAAHDPARPDRAASVKLALGLAGLVYAGGPYTGASLNPARSLGPALLMGHWTHHWVYWVGPLLGAALAALLHRFVLRPRPAAAGPAAPAGPEDVPLNDKV